jgi:hypothetical protein
VFEELSEGVLREMEQHFALRRDEMVPKVYYRLADNCLELSVRFVTLDYRIRELKDAMSRDILAALDEAGIRVASSTGEIVGVPPLRIQGNLAAGPANGAPPAAPGPAGHRQDGG